MTQVHLYPDAGTEQKLRTFYSEGRDHPLLRKGFIFDVDGVLCWDEDIVPGSPEAIARLRQGGKSVIFISNNSTKSRVDYISKFERLGIPITEQDLVLSTYATARYVAQEHPGARVYMLGAAGLRKELELAGLNLIDDPFQAQYVVVGTVFDGNGKISEENSRRITDALQALYYAKAKFIAANPDRMLPTKGGVIPDTGAVIGALSYMLERQPDAIIGKPTPHIVQMALDRTGLKPEDCVIVGDMDTDMLAGQHTGIATVFVRSGAMTEEMLRQQLGISPDFTYDKVIDILQL
ncbi:HAD-superfamily hydrolase, subfamily IIA [Candidatus Vecturithrix granuli]|uniref:HAD-superfamily hydrolase, subfamily IIA n=1 Tax=Vecturithrix granuli TaxID=1499967 RepID=A0A081C945_VECG1|nr:HAD-superfamily hydrolase, subfamily IIA [Candidatus Vecturithrix granuli]